MEPGGFIPVPTLVFLPNEPQKVGDVLADRYFPSSMPDSVGIHVRHQVSRCRPIWHGLQDWALSFIKIAGAYANPRVTKLALEGGSLGLAAR